MRIKFLRGTCTHLSYLVQWVLKTKGPVLELGIGFGSTPTLHELCHGRQLVSYESSDYYYHGFRDFQTEDHKIILVDDWDKIPIEMPWSLAFVDCSPTMQRREMVLRLKPWADYIIIHDTERRANRHFHVRELFPSFKYRCSYKALTPHTTILSDKYPVL